MSPAEILPPAEPTTISDTAVVGHWQHVTRTVSHSPWHAARRQHNETTHSPLTCIARASIVRKIMLAIDRPYRHNRHVRNTTDENAVLQPSWRRLVARVRAFHLFLLFCGLKLKRGKSRWLSFTLIRCATGEGERGGHTTENYYVGLALDGEA